MVDQIFIGYGVGYLGNGATNVVFPLNIFCLAFALMAGDGSASYLSLKYGENKSDEASKGVGNGIAFSVIIALLFCIIILLFLPQLLNLFGCTDLLREYALKYGFIIAIGLPFMIIGTTLNSIIRADGNPKYAMTSMILGAVLNIILDPIFIFVFHMGIEGAAVATVISQILTFVLNIMYIKKFKIVKITKETLKIDLKILKRVLSLGITSFITQIDIVIIMAVQNNLLTKYGAMTKFGAEIPITVLGIVMKVNQILNSIIIGISVGSQPIVGYNYGAGKYDRVNKTLKLVLTYSVFISMVAFVLFQTIPDKIILLFGSGDELYMEFACIAFRTYLLCCVLNAVVIPTGIFLQSIGKSLKSGILSLARKIIFLLPSIFILGKIFGLMGLLYAAVVSDILSFITATTLLIIEVKYLKNKKIILTYDVEK
jgi:putative MATE family efflux protein